MKEWNIIQTAEGISVLREDTHLSKWVAQHHTLAVAEGEIALFKQYIPKGGTVVDAGASLGDHAISYARLVGEGGSVFVFEPNPHAFAALTNNMMPFPWVTVLPVGLADGTGTAALVLEPNAGASHISITPTAGPEDVPVRVTMLDQYIGAFKRLDLIHLDMEGFETRAIKGAEETIKKFKPAIVLEVNLGCLARYGLTEADVYKALDAIGYTFKELQAGWTPGMPQRDVLCLPK